MGVLSLAKLIRVLESVIPHLASLCFLKFEVGVLQMVSTVINTSSQEWSIKIRILFNLLSKIPTRSSFSLLSNAGRVNVIVRFILLKSIVA